MAFEQNLLSDQFKTPILAAKLVCTTSSQLVPSITDYQYTHYSFLARGADIRFNLGAAANASSSHFLKNGERIFIRLGGPGQAVYAIRDTDASSNPTLEVTGYNTWS